VKVQSLAHMVLKVRDQKNAEDFYNGVLGFPIVASNSDIGMTFFSFGEYHHHFAVIAVGAEALPAPDDSVGLYHAAFKIGNSLNELKEARDILETAGIDTLVRDHIVTQSIYFEDPDGNPLEFYVEGSDVWKQDPGMIARAGTDLEL